MKTIERLMILGGIALALAGCGSSVKLDENAGGAPVEQRGTAATPSGGQAGGATAGGAGGRQVTQVDVGAKDPLNDPAGALAKRSIYFDFDSFAIKDEYRGTVEAHSKYLVSNKARKVVVQGNTDERGSREYNLALGQKRSEAVRKAMASLGVAEAQIEAVSFGEEKPRAAGHDEASWAENRRADLVYQ
jgi:peptidoglycan-associated lipoprotein